MTRNFLTEYQEVVLKNWKGSLLHRVDRKEILERCHWLTCIHCAYRHKKWEGFLWVRQRVAEALNGSDCASLQSEGLKWSCLFIAIQKKAFQVTVACKLWHLQWGNVHNTLHRRKSGNSFGIWRRKRRDTWRENHELHCLALEWVSDLSLGANTWWSSILSWIYAQTNLASFSFVLLGRDWWRLGLSREVALWTLSLAPLDELSFMQVTHESIFDPLTCPGSIIKCKATIR